MLRPQFCLRPLAPPPEVKRFREGTRQSSSVCGARLTAAGSSIKILSNAHHFLFTLRKLVFFFKFLPTTDKKTVFSDKFKVICGVFPCVYLLLKLGFPKTHFLVKYYLKNFNADSIQVSVLRNILTSMTEI